MLIRAREDKDAALATPTAMMSGDLFRTKVLYATLATPVLVIKKLYMNFNLFCVKKLNNSLLGKSGLFFLKSGLLFEKSRPLFFKSGPHFFVPGPGTFFFRLSSLITHHFCPV